MEKENLKSVRQWVYWCSNFGDPVHWIKEVWPGQVTSQHMLKKFQAFLASYSPDEAMNRFFRDLSDSNQEALLRYVSRLEF